MTTNNTPPSDATVAAFKATAAKYGLSADAANKTLAAHGVAVEQQQQGGPTGQAVASERPVIETLNEHKHPSLNDRQLGQAAETLRKFWTGDPKVLEDALARAGVKETVADNRTDREKSFDASLGGARPEEYALDGVYQGRSIEPAELGNVDRDMRTMLSAMETPAAIGRSLAEAVLDANKSWAPLTSDGARKPYEAEQRSIALRATGAASWEDLISAAKVAVQKIPRDLARDLARAGSFESGRVLALLYGQGARLIRRQALRDRR